MTLLWSIQTSNLGPGAQEHWAREDITPVATGGGWVAGCRWEGVSDELDVL